VGYEETIRSFDEIDGLKWVRNIDVPTGPNSSILFGDKVTNLVVRQGGHDTEYRVWGIHLATDDQLTFVTKSDDKPIVIPFVDCRRNSRTAGNYFEISTEPDTTKRLVIPRGVAHRPVNVNGLITLNTPVFHWDWRRRRSLAVEVDVINIEKDRPVDRFPLYDVSRFRLPDWAYPLSIKLFKQEYDAKYNTPFVFDSKGQLHILRKMTS
jgi:hypothetical protein